MMTINQGNIFKVIHETGCTLEQAKEALRNSNFWQDAFKYARNCVKSIN